MNIELEQLEHNTLMLIEKFEEARHQVEEMYKHSVVLVKIIRKYIPHKSITELIDEHERSTGNNIQRTSVVSTGDGVVLDGMDGKQKDRQKGRANRQDE